MLEHIAQLTLALGSAIAFLFLLIERVGSFPRSSLDDQIVRRFLLVDGLLLIAGIELVADALHDIDPTAPVIGAVAFACRGAIMAGAIALALTVKETRERRRATR